MPWARLAGRSAPPVLPVPLYGICVAVTSPACAHSVKLPCAVSHVYCSVAGATWSCDAGLFTLYWGEGGMEIYHTSGCSFSPHSSLASFAGSLRVPPLSPAGSPDPLVLITPWTCLQAHKMAHLGLGYTSSWSSSRTLLANLLPCFQARCLMC